MENDQFIPINLELLRIDTILGVDLYVKNRREYILYRSRNIPFNDRVRTNLIHHGVRELYIPICDNDKFARYLENNLSSILADPLIKPEKKRQLVYDSSINIARDLLREPNSPEIIKRSAKVVENMVDLHLKDIGGFKKIVALMPSNYDLINHCANVATYSIAIGKSLGLNKNSIYELGLGALLHDIGKSKIPKEILEKPGRLTSDEFNVVKDHVKYGFDIASGNLALPRESLLPIMWHHERLSGKGYPYGKTQDDIPLFGMITAVADSFDAMTTKRVYQDSQTTFKTLEVLLSETDSYDIRVVVEMVKLLGPEQAIERLRPKAKVVAV